MIAPLDCDDCLRLAETLGDTPTATISTHALLTGRGRAYIVGDPRKFDAALVAPDYCHNEPQAWGQPEAIWRILAQLNGWTAVEVPHDAAPALEVLVASGTRRAAKRVEDLCFIADGLHLQALPVPTRQADLRILTPDDFDLLVAASRKLSGSDPEYARVMLSEATYAAAIIDHRIVARVEAYASSPRYANLGAYVLEEFRRCGLGTALAALVTDAVRKAGRTPVWSTGETNAASQSVARKLGYRQITGMTFVVPA